MSHNIFGFKILCTPINIYDPKSAGAESYLALAEEVIDRKGE